MTEDEHCGGGHRPDISCREISEFLLAYVERELEGEVQHEFERHLAACPPCGHYLDGYRDTVALVRQCGRAELDKSKHKPPPEALIQAILSAKRQLASGEDSDGEDSDGEDSDGPAC